MHGNGIVWTMLTDEGIARAEADSQQKISLLL